MCEPGWVWDENRWFKGGFLKADDVDSLEELANLNCPDCEGFIDEDTIALIGGKHFIVKYAMGHDLDGYYMVDPSNVHDSFYLNCSGMVATFCHHCRTFWMEKVLVNAGGIDLDKWWVEKVEYDDARSLQYFCDIKESVPWTPRKK